VSHGFDREGVRIPAAAGPNVGYNLRPLTPRRADALSRWPVATATVRRAGRCSTSWAHAGHRSCDPRIQRRTWRAGCRLSRSRRSTPASVRPDCTRAARSIHGPVGGGERWLSEQRDRKRSIPEVVQIQPEKRFGGEDSGTSSAPRVTLAEYAPMLASTTAAPKSHVSCSPDTTARHRTSLRLTSTRASSRPPTPRTALRRPQPQAAAMTRRVFAGSIAPITRTAIRTMATRRAAAAVIEARIVRRTINRLARGSS